MESLREDQENRFQLYDDQFHLKVNLPKMNERI